MAEDLGIALALDFFGRHPHPAPMLKRGKIALAVVFVALVGVIGWQVWPPDEPVLGSCRSLTGYC